MPDVLKNNIISNYINIGGTVSTIPVSRIKIRVSGDGGMLQIYELRTQNENIENENLENRLQTTSNLNTDMVLGLVNQNYQTQYKLDQITSEIHGEFRHFKANVSNKLCLLKIH